MLEFNCPRCSAVATADYYGPCSACATQLRNSQRVDGRVIDGASNVPKMNVTPNAVALKADD